MLILYPMSFPCRRVRINPIFPHARVSLFRGRSGFLLYRGLKKFSDEDMCKCEMEGKDGLSVGLSCGFVWAGEGGCLIREAVLYFDFRRSSDEQIFNGQC